MLLGIAALAVLFVLFLAARGFYRRMQSRKRSMQGVLPSASLASQYRDIVRKAGAERSMLERQAAGGAENFELLKTMYREKKEAGAKVEDLSERMLNYTLSMRRTVLQMTAATYAVSAFERSTALLRIYAQTGVESRLPGAKSVQELAERLEAIRERVIEPVLSRKHAELPDPRKFLDQFSIPGPEDGKVEVFDREIDDLYAELKTSLEKVVK